MDIDIQFFIFLILTVLWLIEFIVFPSAKNKSAAGKRSFYLVFAGIVLSIVFSVIIHFKNIALIRGNPGEIMRNAALILYAAGVALRYWSSAILGNSFSRNIEADKEHKLISWGPYRFIRHPLYMALMLMVVSVSIFLRSLAGITFSLVIMTIVLGIRIKEEEKIMEENLGKRYMRWKEKRQLFIPFIF